MRLMLVAGEASGDTHGAALIAGLQAQHPEADLFGVGGPKMFRAGLRLYATLDDLQVHGLVEVMRHLPRLYGLLNTFKEALEQECPDALVCIDYPGFNLKLAAHAQTLGIPVVFFNSPQIWAWRKRRLQKIRKVVDHMLVLFPFEETIYQEAGVGVTWVGHPLVDEAGAAEDGSCLREELGLAKTPVLTLAPGSRPSELSRHLPVLQATLPLLRSHVPGLQVLLPIADTLDAEGIRSTLRDAAVPIHLLHGRFSEAIRACDAAIVASGTASLQTALALTPNVLIYRVAPLTYWLARKLAQVQHMGMANVLAQREIIPELLQDDCTPTRIAAAITPLLCDPEVRSRMVADLEPIRQQLGEPGAYVRAVQALLDFLQRRLCRESR
ncbi:MAG: lipid-A-disaccharide synthase [Deltaproteobacteria bacterium]|nr:lipid-A-disaccharide synthase [Deltaproteobacteria bacterium]